MKFAAITNVAGLPIVWQAHLSYHLTLAHNVLTEPEYARFYQRAHQQGHFIMLDNGAAEEGTLAVEALTDAANLIGADEIVLPDVIRDMDGTISATMDANVLKHIPPRKRAVVPQGRNADEWLSCANYFVDALEFTTLCIPKHAERYPGGRVGLLNEIKKMGWHNHYYIHLLGIHGSPHFEITALKTLAPYVRGIDSAAPFAHAQRNLHLNMNSEHLSHVWNMHFDYGIAQSNVNTINVWASGGTDV